MINIIKGDMVQHLCSNEHLDAYAHQCNCFSRMGRGIAPQLAKVVKGLRQADSYNTGKRSKMGTITQASHNNGAVVYNVYGQYHWRDYQVARGRNTSYTDLKKGLNLVKEDMLSSDKRTLGLPLIGCGLAGGDWDNVVLPMIIEIFESSKIDITIFKL